MISFRSHSAYINYIEQQICGKPQILHLRSLNVSVLFLLLLFQSLFSMLFFPAFLLVPFCFSPLLPPLMLFLPSNSILQLPLPQSSPAEIMSVPGCCAWTEQSMIPAPTVWDWSEGKGGRWTQKPADSHRIGQHLTAGMIIVQKALIILSLTNLFYFYSNQVFCFRFIWPR